MRIKNPILLDASLNDKEMLRPTKGSLSLRLCDVSECSLTLPLDSPNVAMHAWIKVFNQNGFVGIYRRTSNGRNIPNDQSETFRHGIDILQDSIWNAETDFEGTKTQYLTALLNQQTNLINGVKPWVLGTCADASTIKKSIKYNNLMDLFHDLEDEGGDYYFSYDQTSFPWTVSYLARSNTVASEFRLKRNMEKCRISENDSELCTRLVLEVNAMMADSSLDGVDQNKATVRTYNNTAAQAIYGLIVKTEDIDTTDSVPNGPFPEADAFAAKYLADRAAPIVTVQIDGLELYRQTGDTWDEAQLGTLCRAAIPDYDTFISQRLVGVTYPDLFGVPSRITLTLSNATPKTLREQSNLSRSVSTAEKTAVRAGGGGRSNAREIESFAQHFKITDDSNKILKQAGMHLDANGLLVYADDNVNMVGSRFNVQADKIGMVVGTRNGQNYIKAGEIALSINNQGQSKILLHADVIDIDGVVTSLASKDIQAQSFSIYGAQAGTVSLATAVKTIALDHSGNTYTIKVGKMLDTQLTDIGSFSRAVSSANWEWVSGSAKVTLSPQDQNFTSPAVDTYTLQGNPSYNNSTKLVSQNVVVVDEDGNTVKVLNVSLNASEAYNTGAGTATANYNAGWNDCIDTMMAHYGSNVLTGYSTYNNGTSTSLYTSPSTSASIASGAARVWRYGGSTSTRYSLPAKK